MIQTTYDTKRTGLLLVDPFNDFLAPEGKLWPFVKDVAEAVDLLTHLRQIVATVRTTEMQLFFVPHHRWQAGDYIRWKHANRTQIASGKRQLFARGSWGGEFHPDFQPRQGEVIVKEHWAQSGFANTDLDHQLKMHGIEKIILIGMLANTCIESTGRFGMELGYHVTLVKDATAAFSQEAMHAAHAINGPTYAHEILTTSELLSSLANLNTSVPTGSDISGN
jgi:nicotinamidase-related amidase